MKYSITDIKREFNSQPIITVYGSSACKPESELYLKAEQIGVELSKKFIVASGGYTGIMDAVSKGVSSKNGRVIGITTEEITRVEPSSHLSKEYRESTLMTRLQLMQTIADVHLFLSGSTGTLTELALIWDKQKLGLLPLKPILLLGKTWENIFNIMFNENSDVPQSIWKKDIEVKDICEILNSVEDLVDWIANYQGIDK